MPTISVITPSYNSEKFIKECIQSVLNQSYCDWEMLIVDDCSTDNSVKIINKFTEIDNRILLISLEKNVGAAEARNVAIKKAKGRFLAFLDSDDLWKNYKLENQLKFMESKDYAFTFTAYQPMTEDGEMKYSIISAPEYMTYTSYLRNTIIGCLTVMIDREKTGDFEMPNIRSSHDMALWLHLMKRGFNAYGLNQSLAYYRIVSYSNTAKKWKAAKEVWEVYRDVENLSFIYSLFNFIGYVYNAVKKRM